jgi:hypothetical protein
MLLPSLVRTFVVAAVLAVAAACFAQGDSAGQAKAGITDSRALRLAELKNAALQYFEGKKWAEAIKKFEEHLAMLTEPEKGQLVAQVVYLGLAECNFNLEKEEFLPQGDRLLAGVSPALGAGRKSHSSEVRDRAGEHADEEVGIGGGMVGASGVDGAGP